MWHNVHLDVTHRPTHTHIHTCNTLLAVCVSWAQLLVRCVAVWQVLWLWTLQLIHTCILIFTSRSQQQQACANQTIQKWTILCAACCCWWQTKVAHTINRHLSATRNVSSKQITHLYGNGMLMCDKSNNNNACCLLCCIIVIGLAAIAVCLLRHTNAARLF